jgi:hypothetical protein
MQLLAFRTGGRAAPASFLYEDVAGEQTLVDGSSGLPRSVQEHHPAGQPHEHQVEHPNGHEPAVLPGLRDHCW